MSNGVARERISTLLFYATVLLLAYLLYSLFRPFLTPLAWAAILDALFHPPYRRLAVRWGKAWAAATSTAAVTMVIVVPVLLVTAAFIQEAALADQVGRPFRSDGRIRSSPADLGVGAGQRARR